MNEGKPEEETAVGRAIAEDTFLHQAEGQHRREVEILNEVAEYLTSTLDLDEVLQRAADALPRYLTNVQSCSISILEDNQRLFRMRAEWVERPEYSSVPLGQAEKIAGTHVARLVVERRAPVVFPDLTQLPVPSQHHRRLMARGLRSVLYVPLVVHDELIGILHVHAWNEPRPFLPKEIALCQSVANYAAIAFENARLYKEMHQRAEELAILHQVALATATTVDIDELLQKVTDTITADLYTDVFGFVLLDEQTDSLVPHSSYCGIPPSFYGTSIPLEKSVVGLVAQRGEPYIVADVRHEPLYVEGVAATRSEIAVPLKVEERVLGVINVESPRLNAFSQEDARFLVTLAGQVAAVIERVQFYEALRKQAQSLAAQVRERTAELQAEKDRTLAILENAGEGIFLTDLEARILYANPAMERQSGYKRAELLNQPASIFGSKRTSPNLFDDLWTTILSGKRWTGELVNQRKDGALYDIALTIAPIFGFNGEITGFVSVQSDISRLKEIDRLKSRFVSNVSHELRTPLTNIKTYMTLLERGKADKQKQYLDILHHETDRLARLIQDLLDLSRLETEVLPKHSTLANLHQLLQQMYEIFVAKAEAKPLTYQLVIPPDLPDVWIEEHHLGQVLTNLIGNAFAYTPPGGWVTVSGGVDEQAGLERPLVWIQVADNGPGIAPDDMPRLFERFFRGQVAQEGNAPGTGLGLAISQEIIKRYGGRIEVDSQPGEGARFTVWLPAAH